MRKIDEEKHSLVGMAAKTINFEKITLIKLEERAKQAGVSVSKLVNLLCRRIVLNDQAYMQHMMKYHWLKFQEFKFLREGSTLSEDPVKLEIKLGQEGKTII